MMSSTASTGVGLPRTRTLLAPIDLVRDAEPDDRPEGWQDLVARCIDNLEELARADYSIEVDSICDADNQNAAFSRLRAALEAVDSSLIVLAGASFMRVERILRAEAPHLTCRLALARDGALEKLRDIRQALVFVLEEEEGTNSREEYGLGSISAEMEPSHSVPCDLG